MTQELSERESFILNKLQSDGSVSVSVLSQDLGVSEVTIRSDLSRLELMGRLSRTHGGAIPVIHPHIFERQNLNIAEKNRIAKTAASLVSDGDTIMIEAGTTTGLIPKYLIGKRDVHIITNSAIALETAKANPDIRVTITGGEFRRSTDSFVGFIALETIRRFNVKIAFVGTDGFSCGSGITTYLLEGGEVIRTMREKSEEMVLLADSSKYGKTGVVTVLPITSVDTIITDSAITPDVVATIQEKSVRVITCDD